MAVSRVAQEANHQVNCGPTWAELRSKWTGVVLLLRVAFGVETLTVPGSSASGSRYSLVFRVG